MQKHGFDPWSLTIPHAVEQLSPSTTTAEPVRQSPRTATAGPRVSKSPCSATRPATAGRRLRAAAGEWASLSATREKPEKERRPSTARNKQINKYVLSIMSDSLRPHSLALQAPLSMEFSKQEHWNRSLCPTPGDLPDSGIEPESLCLLH